MCLLDYQNAHEYILDYIKTMFGSSLSPVVCRRTRVLFTLFVLCCAFVLFFFVLCTISCQFLWIVLFWLFLRYSLTFIYINKYVSVITFILIFVRNYVKFYVFFDYLNYVPIFTWILMCVCDYFNIN